MFARVTVVEVPPDRFEDARRLINLYAAPRARGLPGWQGGYWLGDRKTGRVVTVAFYDSEENLQASADAVTGWREELIPQVGGTVVAVDDYELMAYRGSPNA
jgi:hypothetical protein